MESTYFKRQNNKVYTDGIFNYTLLPDGTYSISINKDSSAEEALIPESFSLSRENAGEEGNIVAEMAEITPPTVTAIAERAFYGSQSLSKITISKNVNFIGKQAFAGSSILEIAVDPENPHFYAKGNCVISKETNKIVSGCDTSVIPSDENINEIEDYAFSCCYGLKKANIPGNIKIIGEFAFAECESLESLSFCEGVETIYRGAFSACKRLSTLTLPEGVINIGAMAFFMCENLSAVSIPSSVSLVGGDAFACCNKIEHFSYPESEKQWKQICNAGAYQSNVEGIISFGKEKKKFSFFKSRRD